MSVSTAFRRGGWLKIRIPAANSFNGKEIDHFLNDSFLLPMFELWIHWQRQYFRCRLFGHRKISFFVSQSRVGLLKVQRRRVVNLGRDVGLS